MAMLILTISILLHVLHSNDNVRELYSDIESAKARMLKMNPAGLTVGISSVFNDVGQVVDTTENLAPSIDILAKCKVVSERLGFVVQAVEAIAEVLFFFPNNTTPDYHLVRFIHMPRLPGV